MRTLYALSMVAAACGRPADVADARVDGLQLDATAVVHIDDGMPIRRPCTNTLGTELTPSYGRLDGFLVAIVPPGNGDCNADDNHVHLQILANGAVYDVAINVSDAGVNDVRTVAFDAVPPGARPWLEGWHTDVLADYVSLGQHSSNFTPHSSAELSSQLSSELATVNHISVYATGYGADGVHLVHRHGSGHDGLIVTEPLSTPSRLRLFSFANQAF